MPTDLSDLDLEEVSLVGKAATGRRFLLFKNAKGVKMRQTKPARAAQAGAGASVAKADILSIVEKAVEPIRKENEELRAIIRKKDYEEIAKAEFAGIGTPEEGATILKSLEAMPSEARKPIIAALKKASAMKQEAGKLLFAKMGSDRPAPGSAMAQFEELVAKHVSIIQKSGDGPSDPKIRRSLAVQKATRENPDLARAVMAEERAAVIRSQMGVL